MPVQHFATHRVHADRDAQVELERRRPRRLDAARAAWRRTCNGAGSNVKLTGAYFVDGDAADRLRHLPAARCAQRDERPAFKGVLDDKAHAVWRGMIAVAKGAQGTDAFQNNKNLVLTSGAHADSIPGLQIEANDVRCTHASTTIARSTPSSSSTCRHAASTVATAIREIVRGFYVDVLDRIEVEQVREQVQAALWARMDR